MDKNEKVKVSFNGMDAISNGMALLVTVSSYFITNVLNDSIEPGIKAFIVITNICILAVGIFRIDNLYVFKFCCNNVKILNKLYIPIVLIIIGIIELKVQSLTMNGQLHGIHHIITSLIIIPIMIFWGVYYLASLNDKYGVLENYARKHLTINMIQIYASVSISYLFFHWCSYIRDNFSSYSLLINIIYDWLAMIVVLIIMTYAFLSLKYLMKEENRGKVKSFKEVFPYGFFVSVFCFLICWGGMIFVLKEFTLESSYYITVLITVVSIVIYSVMIHWAIGAKAKKSDKIKLVFLSGILFCYSLLIYTKVIQQSKSIPKNSLGIMVAAIILLLLVYIVLKSDSE